ncbi:conserved hypothetical protein [Rhodococcus ruber]|uniref:Uncharacterized protein n=1 Tax=Rhodococcus ruber TaxID=1830 RepID=A0A098BLT0_9NOCA|nr:conserved hypothetical protein [Rhodococcus ruber]
MWFQCSSTLALPVVLDVALERTGRRELAELVADHRLRDEHRHVLATVVDGERVTDEVGQNGGTARPGLDDLLGALFVLRIDLRQEVVVDERALLEAAWHSLTPSLTSASCRYGDDGR